MQGSVQKNTEIALWEMDQPRSRRSKKSGKKRQGDVDIIDLYVDRETDFVRTGRSRQVPRSNRAAKRARNDQTIELIGLNDRVSRQVGQNKRTRRAVETVRQNSRAAEPVRRRRQVEEDWDVELIGQDRAERPQRRKQTEQSKKRRKAKKRRAYLHRTVAVCSMVLCLMIACMAVDLVYEYTRKETAGKTISVSKDIVLDEKEAKGIKTPDIVEDFLEVNDFSRPGTELPVVNSIFVHYTANPGTSARQNRSYFANLAETQERSASAHFIIGYEGEIVQCIPLDEQAYAVVTRNEDSISIECCYLEADGQFTQETYDSLVQLLAWLEQKYHLGSDDILRHYDCGGKKCPIFYVEHEDAWEKLLSDVDTYIAEHGESQL